jgi:hypothetical protein
MPTVFENLNGFRFFFFSLDREEPIHIHIEKDRSYAKFWLDPVSLAKSRNFRSHELHQIRSLIEKNIKEIERRWHEHFSR